MGKFGRRRTLNMRRYIPAWVWGASPRWEWAVQVRVPDGEWRTWGGEVYASQFYAWQRCDQLINDNRTEGLQVRVAVRTVSEWLEQAHLFPMRSPCPVCTKMVTIADTLTYVPHGRLVSVQRDAAGRVQRTSEPCEGSNMIAALDSAVKA